MKIGFIGLGRMGNNMVEHLLEKNHEIVVYDNSPEPVEKLGEKGAIASHSVKEVVDKLPNEKVIWLMVPSGEIIDSIISELTPNLKKGDIIIDGGNSYFEDSIKRYNRLKEIGISFIDCGTSGGMEGARHGACMMIGGDEESFKRTEQLYKDMSVKNGYGYMGSSGAGHFVKMVHNGVEYGMMGAIAEGANALRKHSGRFGMNVEKAISVYANGSIIESRLVSWLLTGMKRPYFKEVSGTVPKGETEEEMENLERLADMPILKRAREMRVETRKKPSDMGRDLALMRNEFGGHAFNERKTA